MKILGHMLILVMLVVLGSCNTRDTALGSIQLRPEDCEIIVAKPMDPVVKYAVEELQNHVKLICGKIIPITDQADPKKFHLYVGIRPNHDKKPFSPEEARYLVNLDGVWLYGKDVCSVSTEDETEAALMADTQAGTLFAVYEFLEDKLNIRWLEPGDEGIVYNKNDVIKLTFGQGHWVPTIERRHMRSSYKDEIRQRFITHGNVPAEMQFTQNDFLKKQQEEIIWKRRMRMGRNREIIHGSPFAKWWKKYGKNHPEYFALNPNGRRVPDSEKKANKINICVSNFDVVKELVKEYVANGNADFIKTSDNDSRGFCCCENCRALDAETPEEKEMPFEKRSKSDRYVYFMNTLLREARKSNPQVKTTYYAYSNFHLPPRREKLDKAIITLMIPNLALTSDESANFFRGWKQAEAQEVYMRPNDLNQDTGLPLGFEQHMFAKYKQSFEFLNMTGTDYDACQGFWPVSGITNYIMARGFYRPERSFADWENEYYQSFGLAANDVRQYYHYWRQIWNTRVMLNKEEIAKVPLKLMRTKLMHLSHRLYSDNDFNLTDDYLKSGLTQKGLTINERRRLEKLLLANTHSRIKYQAMAVNRLGSDAAKDKRKAAAEALYKFRLKHRNDLNYHWENLIYLENLYQDNAGQQRFLGTESMPHRKIRIKFEAEFKNVLPANNNPF